jgi:hypothetical protein
MNSKPFLIGLAIALATGALYFAYTAGQQSSGGNINAVVDKELEQIRADYDTVVERHEDDLEKLRTEFKERTEDLEKSFYGLREELARSGVEIAPLGVRNAPGARPGEEPPEPEPPIAKETFFQLRTNMTYKDTVRILGREGTQTFKMGERDGTVTEEYKWTWINPDGSEGRINVSFQNDRLREKEYRDGSN